MAVGVHGQIVELEARIRLGQDRRSMGRYRALKDLRSRLERLAATKGEWVLEEARDRRGHKVVRFDPVWPGSYAESNLFLAVPKVILTSATIRPKTLELLNIPREDYEFIEYPSSFDVRKRPVIWLPTVRVRHDSDPSHLRLWVSKVDAILRKRRDRRGVVHTVSYSRAQYLQRNSEFSRDMVLHESGGLRDAVEYYRTARPGTVLVSPSVGTGFDFPDDECRFQIIGKVPFPDSRGKVIQARQERDKEYFAYVAAQNLVQMCGRGVRSASDWCETFIIDDNIEWFVNRYKKFFPRWWLEAYEKGSTVPAPPGLDGVRQ